jgi:hypothetical protein
MRTESPPLLVVPVSVTLLKSVAAILGKTVAPVSNTQPVLP